jgi:DNA adenine methylase
MDNCDIHLRGLIGRIGGKSKLKKVIVDEYFPKNYRDMIYVEPFVGGGSIFFYKEPSKKEIINDLDTKVVSIYKGVKKYGPDKAEASINTGVSKKQFMDMRDNEAPNEFQQFVNNYKLYRSSYLSKGLSYNYERHYPKVDLNCQHKRLKGVTILNTDYKNVIKKYDSPDTFFYLDPPYEGSTGSHYKHSAFSIKELYDILKNIKGKFLISFNLSKEATEVFKDYNIYRVKTTYTSAGKQVPKIELLISNY